MKTKLLAYFDKVHRPENLTCYLKENLMRNVIRESILHLVGSHGRAFFLAALMPLSIASGVGDVLAEQGDAMEDSMTGERLLTDDERVELQGQVDSALKNNPGAAQINQNQIELQEGVVMTVPLPGTRGTPDCPYEWVCFYEHQNYDGYRLEIYKCGQHDLFQWRMPDGRFWNDKISSWHNHQSDGAVASAYNWNDRLRQWDHLFITHPAYDEYVGDRDNDRTDLIGNCEVEPG